MYNFLLIFIKLIPPTGTLMIYVLCVVGYVLRLMCCVLRLTCYVLCFARYVNVTSRSNTRARMAVTSIIYPHQLTYDTTRKHARK